MADDLNKNITITVSAQTGQLEQSITNLNKIIDNLLAQQKQLVDSGNAASLAFQNNADKIDIFQKSLQNATLQLNTYLTVLNSSATALQKNQSLITALTSAKDKYSRSVGDNSKKVTELNAAIKSLSASTQQQQTRTTQNQAAMDAGNKSLGNAAQQAAGLQTNLASVNDTLNQQQAAVNKNKVSFDAHKLTMDQLKTSFDEIKDVSGEFGPSLQDAAQGFNLMKSGLAVVKDGLTGVGDALKADGFNFLLQILQMIFDAFVNSSKGTKILQGAISAIGVVVNKVKAFFGQFMDGIIKAVSHPIDSIKELGKMVEQNIINRFTAFSKIIDGLIHLDFKKVADGAIQAVTGVTDATGKIAAAVKTVTKSIVQTGKEIGDAYEYGFNKAESKMEEFHNKSQGYAKHKKYTSAGNSSNTSANKNSKTVTTANIPVSNNSPDPNAGYSELGQADDALKAKQAQKNEEDAKKNTQDIITADVVRMKARMKAAVNFKFANELFYLSA